MTRWLSQSYMGRKAAARGVAKSRHELSEAKQGAYHYVYGPYAEPIRRIDPGDIVVADDFVVELNREKRLAVLLVEQNIDLVRKVASRACVVDKGRIVRTLRKKELRNTETVAEFIAI